MGELPAAAAVGARQRRQNHGWQAGGVAGRETPAVRAARRAGVEVTVHEWPWPDGDTVGEIVLAAAAEVGVDPAVVFKTLIVLVDGSPAVAVVPVEATTDLKAVAAALGGKRAAMAEPADAERLTGYVTGGISPLGQRRRLPTVVDASALDHPTIHVSGGRRGLELELAPADLIRLTEATVGAVTR